MQIHGFNKTTLLDYPGHIAATIFLGSCNFRCPFCHNASLVMHPESQPVINMDSIFSHLKKRKGILEGVCITGGEPTLSKELPDLIRAIKELGYLVKLDTNGSNPKMLVHLAEQHLLDYVAMDIKNSIEHYGTTAGMLNFNPAAVQESVSFLMSSGIPYEFRTTIVKELHTDDDMLSIGNWIQGAAAYYLQNYKDSGDVIFPGLSGCSREELLHFKELLTPFVHQVSLRGVDERSGQ